jgi:XTP/dITP diphosphohydrolase
VRGGAGRRAGGVWSARYGGEPKSDAKNNAKLLADLTGVADRRAHYVAVLVLMRAADDPQPIVAEGEWHGEIVDAPRGEGGFGYDPYFLVPDLGLTVAELPHEEKNRRSHRGQALAQLIARLRLGA